MDAPPLTAEPAAYLAILAGLPFQVLTISAPEAEAGRLQELPLRLDHLEVSRRHCRFSREESSWWIEDLGSRKGTTVNRAPVFGKVPLHPGDKISLGPVVLLFGLGAPPGEGELRKLAAAAPAKLEEYPVLFRGKNVERILLAEQVGIGRDPDSDVVLNHPGVSRRHAVVRQMPQGFRVQDLNSTAGSFVNGQRFDEHNLTIGDRLQIGPFFFLFDGLALNHVSGTPGGAVEARDLCQQAGTATILSDVSVRISACNFAGIIGPSGAGKSTLLETLSGMRSPAKGKVTVDGRDIGEMAKGKLFGYVPQEDIVHHELTVTQALTFGARLRLPPRTPGFAIRNLVRQTIGRLGLQDRADTRIGNLSGGQRKRVSVAVELLGKPSVLFLDEPSSGLDPATEFKLMELLRELAETGCTIICTTHVMENVYLMDQLVVLYGGCLVFDGSPQEARDYFGVTKLASLYDRLADRLPAEWQRELKERPLTAGALPAPPDPARSLAGRQPERARALAVLLKRQWAVLRSDWKNFAILLGQPLVIASLVAWASSDASLCLFFGYIATLWFGCSNAAQEIVKEIPIYRRERVIGVGRHAYLAGKFFFIIAVTLLQAGILYLVMALLEHGLDGTIFLQIGSFAGIAFAAVGIGLAISALARSIMQAVLIVPIILIPLILFSGYTVPVHEMKPGILLVSRGTPTFAAQTLADTSFLWKKTIARDVLSDHWTSFRNINRNNDLKTGMIYDRIGPSLEALGTDLAWALATYVTAYLALRAREKKA